MSPSVAAPQNTGINITLSADAVGVSGNYEYHFTMYDPGLGTWGEAQGWSTNNTLIWQGTTAGDYKFNVRARNVGSSAAQEAIYYLVYKIVNAPVESVTMSPSVAAPQNTGIDITLTADAVGVSGNYEYRFTMYDPGLGTWTEAQGWSTSNTLVWQGTTAGDYKFNVRARNVGSSAAQEAIFYYVYGIVNAPVESVTMSPSVAAPQNTGTNITLTADAVGVSGNYEYRFTMYDPGLGTWAEAQGWSTSNTLVWQGTTAGDYQFNVRARNVGSTAAQEAMYYLRYKITSP
jgi:hypothetical protein